MMKVGWIELNIEEISKSIFAGGDVDKSNLSNYRTEEFNIPIYTNGEKNDGLYGFTNIARVTEDAITVSARGTIGFTCIRNEPYYPAVRLINIIPNEKIDLNYLCYFIKNKTVLHTGSSIPQLTVPMVKKFKIGIPEKISAQQKIVEKLDTAFELIDQAKANIEKNIQNAKELFQSKLINTFCDEKFDRDEIKTIKEISTILGDGLHGTPKYDLDGEYHFINGNNFKNGKIIFKSTTKKVNKEEFEKYKKILNDRTIFVSINGTLGNTAFYENEKVILGKSACYFNVKEEIDKKLIMHQMDSPTFIKYAHKEATGATIKNVSLKSMRNFKVYIPKSVENQQKIVEQLDQLSAQTEMLQEKYKQKLSNLEELKKSILEKAFKGELV